MRDRLSVDADSVRQALGQLRKAGEALDSAADVETDGLVHQVRKRIKKTRALIKLARPAVGKKAVGRVDHRLRDASRPLSQVRDAAALISTLDRLERRSVDLLPPEAFEAARAALEIHKDEVTRAVVGDGQALAHVRKLLRSARRRIDRWDLEDCRHRPFAGIGRAYRAGRDAFRSAQLDPSSEHLHDLRKRVKALGYQLRLLEKNNPSGIPLRIRLLAGLLAEELGEWHDLEILHEFVEQDPAAGPVLKVLNRRRIDLKHVALQRAGVIFQGRPKAFERSLKSVMRSVAPVVAESESDPAHHLLATD